MSDHPAHGDATLSGAGEPDGYQDADVAALIREYPLAWVSPVAGSAELPSLLPLMAELDDQGRLVALIGHMARRNPLHEALSRHPSALILFTGPQAYVSPAQVSDPGWAPTWNYAQLRVEAEVRFEPEKTREALDRLLVAMGEPQRTGWTPDRMGPRYEPMARAIIAFRAEVVRVRGRFKLGREERPEMLRDILDRHPDPDLVRWMRRMNADRL